MSDDRSKASLPLEEVVAWGVFFTQRFGYISVADRSRSSSRTAKALATEEWVRFRIMAENLFCPGTLKHLNITHAERAKATQIVSWARNGLIFHRAEGGWNKQVADTFSEELIFPVEIHTVCSLVGFYRQLRARRKITTHDRPHEDGRNKPRAPNSKLGDLTNDSSNHLD